MKILIATLFLSLIIYAKSPSKRGPAVDPDYPVFTEAVVPGVTVKKSPKVPSLDPIVNELENALAKSGNLGSEANKNPTLNNPGITHSASEPATLKKGRFFEPGKVEKVGKLKSGKAANK